MSDEAKKRAKEYVDTNLSWDLCESSKWDEIAADTYLAGYTQGRADALKELEQLQREAWEAAVEAYRIYTEFGERSSFDDYLSSKSKEGK